MNELEFQREFNRRNGIFVRGGYEAFHAPVAASVYQELAQSELIFESCTIEDIENEFAFGIAIAPMMMLEAITTKASAIKNTMLSIARQLDKSLNGVGLSVQRDQIGVWQNKNTQFSIRISKPRKSGAVAIMTAQILISDGQSIGIVFHAPDNDPLKINATDTLIAFRFLLNSRDITHVVAPQGGKDISLAQLNTVLTSVIQQNSASFQSKKADKKAKENELAANHKAIEQAESKIGLLNYEYIKVSEDIETLNREVFALQKKIDKENKYQERLRKELESVTPPAATGGEVVEPKGTGSTTGAEGGESGTQSQDPALTLIEGVDTRNINDVKTNSVLNPTIKANATEGNDAIWYSQGKPNTTIFNFEGKPDPATEEKLIFREALKQAQQKGFSLIRYKHSRLQGIYVLQNMVTDEVLTKAGMEKLKSMPVSEGQTGGTEKEAIEISKRIAANYAQEKEIKVEDVREIFFEFESLIQKERRMFAINKLFPSYARNEPINLNRKKDYEAYKSWQASIELITSDMLFNALMNAVPTQAASTTQATEPSTTPSIEHLPVDGLDYSAWVVGSWRNLSDEQQGDALQDYADKQGVLAPQVNVVEMLNSLFPRSTYDQLVAQSSSQTSTPEDHSQGGNEPIQNLTYEQWVEQEWGNNEYKEQHIDYYVEENGLTYETMDMDKMKKDLYPEIDYHNALDALPRDAVIPLSVFDAITNEGLKARLLKFNEGLAQAFQARSESNATNENSNFYLKIEQMKDSLSRGDVTLRETKAQLDKIKLDFNGKYQAAIEKILKTRRGATVIELLDEILSDIRTNASKGVAGGEGGETIIEVGQNFEFEGYKFRFDSLINKNKMNIYDYEDEENILIQSGDHMVNKLQEKGIIFDGLYYEKPIDEVIAEAYEVAKEIANESGFSRFVDDKYVPYDDVYELRQALIRRGISDEKVEYEGASVTPAQQAARMIEGDIKLGKATYLNNVPAPESALDDPFAIQAAAAGAIDLTNSPKLQEGDMLNNGRYVDRIMDTKDLLKYSWKTAKGVQNYLDRRIANGDALAKIAKPVLVNLSDGSAVYVARRPQMQKGDATITALTNAYSFRLNADIGEQGYSKTFKTLDEALAHADKYTLEVHRAHLADEESARIAAEEERERNKDIENPLINGIRLTEWIDNEISDAKKNLTSAESAFTRFKKSKGRTEMNFVELQEKNAEYKRKISEADELMRSRRRNSFDMEDAVRSAISSNDSSLISDDLQQVYPSLYDAIREHIAATATDAATSRAMNNEADQVVAELTEIRDLPLSEITPQHMIKLGELSQKLVELDVMHLHEDLLREVAAHVIEADKAAR